MDVLYIAMLTERDARHVVSFFFQAEDGIRDLVRSRGLGDVYKRQLESRAGRDGGDALERGSTRLSLFPRSGSGAVEALSLIHI